MFFVLSKLVGFVLNVVNLTALLVLLGLVLLGLGRRRTASAALGLAALVLCIGAWTTTGALLLHPLEQRYARPDPAPGAVAGVVVLGGGFEGGINRVRGGYELNETGDRFVEAAVLARRYPEARIVVTGGSGSLVLEGEGDGETAPRLLTALGVSPERLVMESRSRNTHENALFTRALVEPRPGETWLLVTSAFHMPRSMGLFRKAGFDVTPWPVDYRTAGDERFGLARDNEFDSLSNLNVAVREWVGLVAYRLTGRTDALIP